jgi:hypothetical protein
MPDHTEIPPVLQTLGDDLLIAMKEAVARQQRAPRRRVPTISLRWTPRRWATAAVVALGAVAAALVLGTTGGGPPNAFADWSATPTAATTSQLQAAEAACQQESPDLGSLTPTISDFRGPNSLLVYAQSATTTVCDTGNAPFPTLVAVWAADSSPVVADAIDPETQGLSTVYATGQLFFKLAGRVGSDVTAVTLVLGDGSTVTATVANGWFAAWWPANWNGGQPGEGGPIGHAVAHSAQVTTTTGTTTQALDWNSAAPPPESINGRSLCGQGPGQLPAACGPAGATGTTGATGATAVNN